MGESTVRPAGIAALPRRPGTTEVAELLTSELVTNALIHTDHDAVLTATVGPADCGWRCGTSWPAGPALRVPNADDGTHGRGLVLVQSLADAWGVGRTGWARWSGSNWTPSGVTGIGGRVTAGHARP